VALNLHSYDVAGIFQNSNAGRVRYRGYTTFGLKELAKKVAEELCFTREKTEVVAAQTARTHLMAPATK